MLRTPDSVGILGIGIHLPPEVRKNDWWPTEVVDGWRRRAAEARTRQQPPDLTLMGPGARLALGGMMELAGDPFSGAVERRIAAPGVPGSDMETAAARDAIERAGIDAADIDLLLVWSGVPDLLNAPNACVVHRKLGLGPRCFTLSVEAACNAFQLQASIAEQMIRGGQARYALLVQGNNSSAVTPFDDPVSTVFGDAATAVVMGRVADGFGLLAQSHRTNSDYNRSLGTTVAGKDWFEDGRCYLQSLDRPAAFRMLLNVADFGKEVLDESIARAGFAADRIDFFACHQGTRWLRAATQEVSGLTRARSLDTFAWAGNTSAANLPLVMGTAERQGLLKHGDVIATYSGGTGITYTSLVLRWGK